VVELLKKGECCGCAACFNACPIEAVKMEADDEGFLYPVVSNKCVDCGKCLKACPVINLKKEQPFTQKGYVVQNKNLKVLRESTSGGAFTAIAEYIIENNGVVFGAAFTDNNVVTHISIDNISDLKKFRNSKYVQSEIGTTFKEAKDLLEENRLVCFSGTPCQIEGLVSYLNEDYDNLITVDVVCRAVPSPFILKKYLNYKTNEDNIKLLFRDKYYGYKYSNLNILDDNGESIYHGGIESDEMLRAFFSNICVRPSCYECNFKKRYRVSDITIWDCFEVGKFFPEIDNDKGATKVLIHTEKGNKTFENAKEKLIFKEIESNLLVEGAKEMVSSVERNERREEFLKDANQLSSEDLFKKYFPITASVRFEKAIRVIGNKFGFYMIVRNLYKKLFGDRKR